MLARVEMILIFEVREVWGDRIGKQKVSLSSSNGLLSNFQNSTLYNAQEVLECLHVFILHSYRLTYCQFRFFIFFSLIEIALTGKCGLGVVALGKVSLRSNIHDQQH